MAGTLQETLICLMKLSFKDFWSYYIKSSIAVKILNIFRVPASQWAHEHCMLSLAYFLAVLHMVDLAVASFESLTLWKLWILPIQSQTCYCAALNWLASMLDMKIVACFHWYWENCACSSELSDAFNTLMHSLKLDRILRQCMQYVEKFDWLGRWVLFTAASL